MKCLNLLSCLVSMSITHRDATWQLENEVPSFGIYLSTKQEPSVDMENFDLSMKSKRFNSFRLSLKKRKDEADDGVARCLKPLVIFLKCLGIEWIRENEAGPRHRVNGLIRLMGWLFFAQNVGSCFVYISLISSTLPLQNLTAKFSFAIIYTNEILFKVINHLALLLLAGSPRQLQLERIFRQLDYSGLNIKQSSRKLLLTHLLVSCCEIAFTGRLQLILVVNNQGDNICYHNDVCQ